MHARRPDRHDRRGGQGVRPVPQGRRPRQEHVRARACCRGCTAGRPSRRSRSCRSGSPRSPTSATPTSRRTAPGWNFGETTETFAVSYEIKPAPMPTGTYRNITGNLALAYGLIAGGVQSGLPLFLGSYPITPASDILHELSKHKAFGVTTFQAEDEIAGIGAAIGASFAGSLGVTTTSGPGIALKSESIGLAVMTELPAARHRRPARRPVDRPADQDRAGRPAAGDVRPQRRVAGADRRAAVARRLLRRRARGRPDRGHLPHAGDAAVRRHARQRLRAVADPRARRAARRSTPASRPRPTTGSTAGRRDGGVLALPARRGDAGAAVGDPRHAGPRAPHRRPREGRRPRQHLLRPGQPRLHGPHPRRPRWSGSPSRCRRWRSTTRRGAGEGAGARLGLDVRPDRRRRTPGAQGRLPRRAGAPAPPQPVPARPRRDPEALRQGADPRDEPRPARAADPRRSYLVDAVGYNQVSGMPLKAAELAEAIGNLVAEAEGIEVDLERARRRPSRRSTSDEHHRPAACPP